MHISLKCGTCEFCLISKQAKASAEKIDLLSLLQLRDSNVEDID